MIVNFLFFNAINQPSKNRKENLLTINVDATIDPYMQILYKTIFSIGYIVFQNEKQMYIIKG